MKIIASSLLVLGLLAVQVSEANAVVCALAFIRLDAPRRVARRSCAVQLALSACPARLS